MVGNLINNNTLAQQMSQINSNTIRYVENNFNSTNKVFNTTNQLNMRQNEMYYDKATEEKKLKTDIRQTEINSDTYARRLEYAMDDTIYYERYVRRLRQIALFLSFAVIFLLFLALFETKYQKPTTYIYAVLATLGIFLLRVILIVVWGVIKSASKA